ncbi:OsmC family protein [Rhodohalobacter sp. 614A]|uniref:OsmC family protein n=1 Tax=Rhodohalobacter sp. 614A TaxID=2908649 RepID=UPI001F30CBC2|nr:OsmC family protein [Rhodohalobacter sp. 614A]
MSESADKIIVHIHLGDQNYKTVMTAGNHELIADEPEEAGGSNEGPGPYDYLLMALGSCSVITMKMYAERKKWPVEDIFIEMRHSKVHADDCVDCDDPNAKIDRIEKEIIIKGDLNEEQLNRLLEISKKCPVHKTLLSDIEIDSTLG